MELINKHTHKETVKLVNAVTWFSLVSQQWLSLILHCVGISNDVRHFVDVACHKSIVLFTTTLIQNAALSDERQQPSVCGAAFVLYQTNRSL